MEKEGACKVSTNYEAFTDFKVNPRWISVWLQRKKLRLDVAHRLYIKTATNIQWNLANLAAYKRGLTLLLDLERQQTILDILEWERCVSNPPTDPDYIRWDRQYLRVQFRYRTLILVGGSLVGKTHFCQYMFGDPRKMLVLNCEVGKTYLPDLAEFSREDGHKGITFDEGSPQLVLAHKRVFQCLPFFAAVKQSPTQIHVLKVMLSGIRLIVTTNTWFRDLRKVSRGDRAWLSDNVYVVRIREPLFRAGVFVHT